MVHPRIQTGACIHRMLATDDIKSPWIATMISMQHFDREQLKQLNTIHDTSQYTKLHAIRTTLTFAQLKL